MILKSERTDPKVIQSEYNCIALCRALHLPFPEYGIIKKADRIIFPYSLSFIIQCNTLEELGEFARWDIVANHDLDPTDDFPSGRYGWRQTFLYVSCQVVVHTDRDGHPQFIEMDFDLFNPERGLAAMLPHAGEFLFHWIFKTKTDPYKVARVLHRRGYRPKFIRKKDQEWAAAHPPKQAFGENERRV